MSQSKKETKKERFGKLTAARSKQEPQGREAKEQILSNSQPNADSQPEQEPIEQVESITKPEVETDTNVKPDQELEEIPVLKAEVINVKKTIHEQEQNTQTQSEAIPHAESIAKLKLITEHEPIQQGELNQEQNTQTQSEVIPHEETELREKKEAEKITENKPNVEQVVIPDQEAINNQEEHTAYDPANELLAIVKSGQKKKRMEDERIRRTYWLHPDEIKMVDELVKMTGQNKYEVVGLAIRSMHQRALEAKKQSKKKKS